MTDVPPEAVLGRGTLIVTPLDDPHSEVEAFFELGTRDRRVRVQQRLSELRGARDGQGSKLRGWGARGRG